MPARPCGNKPRPMATLSPHSLGGIAAVPLEKPMRLALSMALVLLSPFLARADEVPRNHFSGIVLDDPIPAAFETGQALPLAGSVEDDGISFLRFSFLGADGLELDFWCWVVDGRFEREAVFAHGAAGEFDLVVHAQDDEGTESLLGRFDGLRADRGEGAVALPRRYFPLVHLDEPLPTRLTTGEALHVAGSLQDYYSAADILLQFGSEAESYWYFFFLVDGGRFERTLLLPREAEEASFLLLYVVPREGEPVVVGAYTYFDVRRGAGPVEIPRRFFSGLAFDEPLPLRWPVQRPLILAGRVDPSVRGFWFSLEPVDGGQRRLVFPGVEDGRFHYPVRLRPGETGPLRLTGILQLQDDRVWRAGEIVIEGVDASLPDLEVGVLAMSLLAGGQGRVPLFNRGDAAVELGSPEVEGPFEVEGFPSVLGPGEAGGIVVRYDGPGGDEGLLTLVSDDPFRPRVSIALSGLEVQGAAADLVHLRADASGRIESGVDLEERDLVLALYAAPMERFNPSRAYDISLDGSSALARPAAATPPDRRDSVDYRARQLERTLSLRVQQQGLWAGKPAAVQDEVGDSRLFRFAGESGVAARSFKARVAAVNERVVAWVQEDLREDDDNIDEGRMQAIIDQFAEDYPVVVEAFGTASDVDGDGRVAVLVTHLMEDVGAAGQFRASSLLPRSLGGDGNLTDLLWANPLVPEESWRSLLAHELQHLISFNQHVLVRQGISEEPWLNEGLSHLAEDLVEEPPNENYRLVRTFLGEPASVGLNRGILTFATRGAAYLFVRGLVDLLGEGVLLRLVQTDRIGRENVEAATGESFADLMARWGAQLYLSGTGQSRHPRLNYSVPSLQSPDGRGFPPPVPVAWRLGEEPPGLGVRPWGLQFLHVTGDGRGTLRLQTEARARLGAVPLAVAKAAAAASMAADHFAGITFDSTPPLELTTGEPLLFEGTTADSVEQIHLEFVPEEGGEAQTFFMLVDGGRFERTIYFFHEEAGTYTLNVYVPDRRPTPFLGTFRSLRAARGEGPVQVPTRYFNRVRLDRPLPTFVHVDRPLRIGGEVSDAEATLIEFSLRPLDAEGEVKPGVEITRSLAVEAGRFRGEVRFDEVPTGLYRLSVNLGPAGDLTYVGAVTSFEILPMVTSLELAAGPPAFALHPNYPNPFNSRTHLSFSLPEDQPSVELAVYDLLGQKLAVLVSGARESGFHSVEWDGRDDEGRLLASGSYLYRLRAGPYEGVGKLLLLR